jgi:eukaryotic-like serine/threonine-protein kinase
MGKPSEPRRSLTPATGLPRQYAEDAPTQVDDLVPPPPRASAPPPLPLAPTSSSPRPASSSNPVSIGPISSRETLSEAGSSRGASGSASLVTAHETLGLQEVTRTRRFMYVALALVIAQVVALFFLGGDPTARIILSIALLGVFTTAGWFLLKLRRDDGAYTVGRALIVVYATIFAAFSGIYFYGVFSPGPVIVPLGVQFYCTGQSDKASVAVIATCAITYAVLAGLTMAGLLPDVGLVRAYGIGTADRIVMLLVVESIFAAVYVTARATRSATLHAIEQHDVVVRSLAQRDALLREARHDLVHAMRVGGIGRYSGEVIGTFRLGGLIGRGAMGEVYEALALDTKVEAAIKLVHPQLLAEQDVVDRFLREAMITSALKVPNVVRVLDASTPDAPIPYLAMERLHGEDLANYLREHKRMPMKKLVAMVKQVAAGLDAAHAAGVVHRDLKPRNLFCAKSARNSRVEVWKILDFGVSKLDSAGTGTLTRGQVVGTPGYMAPEQARAKPVGPRADIFSLGVVAYRAATGSPPFSADTSLEILQKIVNEQPIRPTEIVTTLPEDINLVLAISLAKNPADRFASAGEFAQAFEAASKGRIDPRLATRAHSILLNMPWGERSPNFSMPYG